MATDDHAPSVIFGDSSSPTEPVAPPPAPTPQQPQQAGKPVPPPAQPPALPQLRMPAPVPAPRPAPPPVQPPAPAPLQAQAAEAPVAQMALPATSYTGFWLGLGIFFFVAYFIPISAGRVVTWPSPGRAVVVFFWDLFGSRDFAELAALATYLMLAGIALPLVGYLVPGLAKLITLCSIGALGVILVLVAESSAYFAVRDLALLALLLALIGNRIRREMPDSLLARLLAGLSAGAAVVLLLAGLITGLAQGSFGSPRPGLNIIGIILNVLCILALIASAILLLITVGGHPKIAALSRAARLLAIIGVSVLLGWGLVSATIGACIAGGALSGIWAFLMTLRTTGFLLGVLAILGISGYPLLKMAALALPPDVHPDAPTPV